MNSRSALGAAGAIALTVAGGVSALFLTVGQANAADGVGVTTESATIGQESIAVEYVDQYGNPVAAPNATGGQPEVLFVDSAGNPVAAPNEAQAPAEAGQYEAEENGEADQHGEMGEHAEMDEHAESD